MQGAGIHAQQAGDDRQIGQRVGQEGRAGAEQDDEGTGQCGSRHAGEVEDRAVEGEGADELGRFDGFRQERLERRFLDDHGEPERQGQGIEGAQPGRSGQDEHGGDQREGRHDRLGGQQGAPPGVPVHEYAAVRAEQQERQELQGRDDAQDGAVAVRQLQREPVLGHLLHPRTGVGRRLAEREEPEVGVPQQRPATQ